MTTPTPGTKRRSKLIVLAATIALMLSLLPFTATLAAVSISPATGGSSISADTTGGTYTALTGPSISGSASGDLGAGTLTLTAPAGFNFHAATGSAVLSGAGCGTLNIDSQSVGVTTITVATSGSSTGTCSIAFSGLEVRPTSGTPLASGSIQASGLASGSAGSLAEAPGAANHLGFTTYPTNPSSTALGTIRVAIQDQFNNTVTSDTRQIGLQTNKNFGQFVCSVGEDLNAAVSGVATFNGCGESVIATGYTVSAIDDTAALTTIVGASFDITSGPATNIELCWGAVLPCTTTPPTTITGGVAFPTQPTVRVLDNSGNTVTSDNSTSILLSFNVNAGDGVLTCTGGQSKTVTAGVATFAGCAIDKAANGYSLHAAASGQTSATTNSQSFNVASGPADHLAFTAYPSNPSTTSLGTIAVAVKDLGGNTVSDTRAITLTINKNSGTFTCSGGLSKAAVAGVATFSSCTQTNATTAYIVSADDGAGGLALVAGASFDVTSGPATKLAFCWGAGLPCSTTVPTTVTGGIAFSTQPTIRVQDVSGNTVTSDSTTVVALSIGAGTPTSGGPGTLTCTGGLSKTVTNGVATFVGCSIDKTGVGYKLTATGSPAYTSSTSNAFTVVAGPATKLGFTTQPTNASTGTAFPTQPVVVVQDAGGNTVTSGTNSTSTVTLSIGSNPGGGTLTCTGGLSKAAVAGIATFSGCKIDKAGTGYTLAAAATGLTSVSSNAFNVATPTATLTLTSDLSTTTWRQFINLSAQFSGTGGGSRLVTFQRMTALLPATWVTIGTATTNTSGRATFSYGPPYNSQFRAVFAGATDLAAVNSNTITVHVRYKVTLKPGAGTTTIVRTGTRITYAATSRPTAPAGLQRVTFLIYKRVNGIWTFRTSATIPTVNGVASFSWRWSRGEWYMRARGNATIHNTTAYSLLSKVTAR